ncbi:DUF4179 domain-containing protein [Rossellomorea sp. YZS02]|uniref:DUF4179 domain-containing protein n=1 Tax=Rossellomorea sp. YZS02 TaxID=3097358 RepID=UPI002A17089A|nr:DUF4179 domain-containing protein [Rossellomorea sp. YZS02]MDX8342369.1 DUF4179 domain-containing protein [Rossellomorea sp. YZS02]
MAKVETSTVTAKVINDRELETTLARVEGEKHSLYALGRVYLQHQQEIEDVFYRTIIRLLKESKKRKKNHSTTSIFIEECLEMTADASSTKDDQPFHIFQQLKGADRDAVALVYVKGCSKEEAANILDITVDEVESRLFSGIRKLRGIMGFGTGFSGCANYQKDYLDYLGKSMERPDKVEFEIHIYHCPECQEDLASFQEVTLALTGLAEGEHAPGVLMERVRSRLKEREERSQKRKKKRKSILLSFAGVFFLLIMTGFVTGGFARLYYSYTEENEQLRTYLQEGIGERLNLEAESDGVKITIKSVVADDVQTLVFYEVENEKKDERYMMNAYEGIYIENERDVLDMDSNTQYYSPPIDQNDIHNDEENVYRGTMSLMPVSIDKGTIKLNVARLMQVPSEPEEGMAGRMELRFAEGDWSFEIPFEKQSSRVHQLDQVVEVGGIPVRLDQLTIAPTTTVLQYSIQNGRKKERIDRINFDSISVDGEKKKADIFGANMYVESYEQQEWNSFTSSFDTLYFENPGEVTVHFDSIHLTVDDRKTIELGSVNELPQTFQYQGNTVTIDKIQVGNPAHVELTHDINKERTYENIQYGFSNFNERADDNISVGISGGDGMLMDKEGNFHKPEEFVFDQEEQPRYFDTEQTIEFYNQASDEDIVPKQLVIEGYSTTKYVDDSANVDLEKD